MNSEPVLRLIIDPPLPGPLNMARDEAILTTVSAGQSPPTLRFYQWNQPTISLGYFQHHGDIDAQDETIRALPVVRRQTGGGAILHDDELTYALIVPLEQITALTSIESLYMLAHDAFIAALDHFGVAVHYRGGERGNAQRGPFFCFARTHRLDLVINNQKILGSAQRRIKNAVLQHGSLILRNHFPQQPSAELLALTGDDFQLPVLIQTIAAAISRKLRLELHKTTLSPQEIELAGQIETDKYRHNDWNQLR